VQPGDPEQARALPGYDVQELLGFGATGEVWRAVEQASGEQVALKRLRAGAPAAAADALRQEAALLRSLDTPHVLRLRAVVGEAADTVLVLDHAAGGSLASLLARRGSLDPGEVVTVAGPLGQALAAAHARGLVHGDVTPSNVLFTGDGMPVLSDFGVARAVGARPDRLEGTAEYLDPAVAGGGQPGPASDVWALAAVCHHMLSGSPPHEGGTVDEVLAAAGDGGRAPLGLLAPEAPRPLVEAVEAALQRDPARRPDAAAFAASVRRAHAAAPVRLRGERAGGPLPVPRPTHAVPRHAAPAPAASVRRPPRWVAPVLAAVLLLSVAGGVGWWLGRSGEPPAAAVLPAASASPSVASPAPAPSPPVSRAPDWPAVLDGLDAVRAEAFATVDVARLDAVYAPGAPGRDADADLVARLAADGVTASGVRHEVVSVVEQERGPASARLLVVDTLTPYEVRDAAGQVTQRVPARGEATYVVELALVDDSWRLVRVTPA
jgi:eukaryotic-like serine/threonine-protein kinase